MFPRRLNLIFLCLFALGFSACKEVALHHQLNEFDADKILVLLDQNGIEASKEQVIDGQNVTWTLKVDETQVIPARRLLVQNNLPHRPELGLSGVYSEKGLIPTPDEQRARFLLALKGEVVNALRKIPGVNEVGVVLNVPEEEGFSFEAKEPKRPSASVVLRVASLDLMQGALSESKVQRFVANAIPNMQAQDVVVLLSTDFESQPIPAQGPALAGQLPPPLRELPQDPLVVSDDLESFSETDAGASESRASLVEVAGLSLDAESVIKFRIYLIVFLCVMILLSAALLFTVFRFSQVRRAAPQPLAALPAQTPELLTGAARTIHETGRPG